MSSRGQGSTLRGAVSRKVADAASSVVGSAYPASEKASEMTIAAMGGSARPEVPRCRTIPTPACLRASACGSRGEAMGAEIEGPRMDPVASSPSPSPASTAGAVAGIGRLRHVLGTNQAPDDLKLAVPGDGGDGPGDRIVLRPVGLADLDRRADLACPGLRRVWLIRAAPYFIDLLGHGGLALCPAKRVKKIIGHSQSPLFCPTYKAVEGAVRKSRP